MNLTSEQITALHNGQPVSIILEQTECIVVRKDIYDRMAADQGLATDEEQARIGWESGKEIGWDTPEMAQYNNYDAYRQ
jgi:hypothetical protein